MANFNPDNVQGNAKRLTEHLSRATKTPGIMTQLSQDEVDVTYHLLDVMGEIYFRERTKNE